MDAIYEKAKAKGIHSLNLEFMRRLSKNLKGVVDAYRSYIPMDEDYRNDLLDRVPTLLRCNKHSVREVLRVSIFKLTSQQDKITHLSQRICSENGASVKINNYVAHFDQQYQNWYADISKAQLQIIGKDIESMKKVYSEIRNKFDSKVFESGVKRSSIQNLTSSVNSMFKQFLQETVPLRIMKNVFKLKDSIETVCSEQDQLLIIYTDMISILIGYNKQRGKWAGLLIEGSRSSH